MRRRRRKGSRLGAGSRDCCSRELMGYARRLEGFMAITMHHAGGFGGKGKGG